eukprot:15470512-Alexandrium_andersonii.AAC.1
MPKQIKLEMAACAKIVPLLAVDAAKPWHLKAFMSDASEDGAGVVATLAAAGKLREEARWAPSGGWT